MNKFYSSIILSFICVLFTSYSHAHITAANIEVSPFGSNNGAFTLTWDAHKDTPDEYCIWFEITVLKTGTQGIFDYYETNNCNQRSFSVTNYPAGDYEIEIDTAYESFANGNYYFNTAGILPFSVSVVTGPATVANLNADFESGWGAWTNVGPFNWYLKSGQTPSVSTGPLMAAQGSYYAYMESSSGYSYYSGNTAILQSSSLSSSDTTITFQYHMYGANTGALYLELFNGSQWVVIWNKSGQQQSSNAASWSQVSLPVFHTNSNAMLRFRAVAVGGYRGDIGIDNIRLGPSSVTYEYETSGRLIETH